MRSLYLCLFSLLFLGSSAQSPAFIPGDILIQLNPGKDVHSIQAELQWVNDKNTELQVVREVSAPMAVWLLHFNEANIDQHVMLRAIKQHPAVRLAQNNHIVTDRATVPNDPNYNQQWWHQNIQSEEAWDITTGGLTATGDTIVVCIIENSDLPHPDLIANAWFNSDEIPNNGVDEDGNGYVDDYEGWNPAGNNDNVYGGSHGTQVAGMIGARGDNQLGVSGANWDVKMMVVTRDGISEAAVVASYTYPFVMRKLYNQTNGDLGAFIVATNASWGIDGGDPAQAPLWCAMYDSLGSVGVLNCGATANNPSNIDVVGDLPTACPSDFMVSVTATDINDIRQFSAYGLTTIDVGAPGDNVYTTSIGGGYGNTSGTSFASPLTAGIIGLLYSVPCASMMTLVKNDPAAGALYVRDALFNGVDVGGNLVGQTVTGGRVNSYNSALEILNNCGACPEPYNLAANNTSGSDYDLVWSANTGTSYNIRYRETGTATWTTVNGLLTMNYQVPNMPWCTEFEFQVEADCDTVNSGFGASHIWTTQGCCVIPTTFAATNVTTTTANLNWTGVLAANTYDLRYREVATTSWTDVMGLTTSPYMLTGLDSCTSYEFQIRTVCMGTAIPYSNSFPFSTNGCGDCEDLTFCPSISADATEEWIVNVTVGTLNNTSGSDNGYGDYTGMSTPLNIGQAYPISLAPGYSGTPFAEYFKIWIDLDHDGSFTQTNELVFDAGATATTTVTGNLLVPIGAITGITRMRVIMKYNTPAADGCEDAYAFGETEDYCVDLMDIGLGITSANSVASVLVYPHPANDVVNFTMQGTHAQALTLTIMDATGRMIRSLNFQGNSASVNSAMMADGNYVYRIDSKGVEVARGRLVVVH